GSEYTPSRRVNATTSPVSSRASRTAASSTVSPYSTNPPGSAQPSGANRRLMRTIPLGTSMIVSTVGAGWRAFFKVGVTLTWHLGPVNYGVRIWLWGLEGLGHLA